MPWRRRSSCNQPRTARSQSSSAAGCGCSGAKRYSTLATQVDVRCANAANAGSRSFALPRHQPPPWICSTAPRAAIDVRDVFDAKCTAVAAHRSQLTVVGDHYTTRDGQSGRVPALERYRLGRRSAEELRPSWPQPGGSLGTFSLAAVLAVIAGVVVGALATLVHQSSWSLGGTEIPVGIVLGTLALGSLLVGLRLIWASRALASLAGGAALVVTLLLSTVSRGGSVLVPNNAAGVVWTLSAGLIVAISIAWPGPGTLRSLRRLRAASGTSLSEGGIMDTQPPRKGRRSL